MIFFDLEGWDEDRDGEEVQEGRDIFYVYIYMYMIYFVVQQKLTQHCKAVILQFKRTKSQESQERALTASRAYDNCALQELFFLYFETTQEATQ